MIRIEMVRKRTEIGKDKENELRKEIFMQLVKDNIADIIDNVDYLLRDLDNEIIKQSDLGENFAEIESMYADMQLGNALRETDHNKYLFNIYIKGDNSCALVRQYLYYRIITDKLKDYIEEGYNIHIIPTENKIKIKW